MSRVLLDFFWVKIKGNNDWQIASTIHDGDDKLWWRWGDKWPVKTDWIIEVGPKINRPLGEPADE